MDELFSRTEWEMYLSNNMNVVAQNISTRGRRAPCSSLQIRRALSATQPSPWRQTFRTHVDPKDMRREGYIRITGKGIESLPPCFARILSTVTTTVLVALLKESDTLKMNEISTLRHDKPENSHCIEFIYAREKYK